MWGVEGAGGCWKTDAAHTLERPLGGRGLISAVLAMSQRTWLGLDWETRKRLGNGGLPTSQRLWGRGVASSEDRCKSSQNAESRIKR